MWLFLSFFGKRIGRSDIELSRKYLFRGLDWIVFKSRLDVSPSLFKFPLKTVPLARATLNYNGNARTIILVDSWSFLRHFLLFLFLSREKTQHFDENHFARPIKSTEPWTASPSFQRFPRNGIPSTRYRPSTFPSPSFFFLDLFPTRWGSIKKTEKERKEEGECDQWNSVSANLCRWNVETDRSGKVENNRSSVKPRTRPHPSRVIPLKTFPSTRRSAEGWWWVDALGRDVKAFVRFEFLRRVRRWMLTSSARIFLSFREGETESFEDDGNFLRAWRTIGGKRRSRKSCKTTMIIL